MDKKETLKKIEPILEHLGNANKANDYFQAIESITNEISKWQNPSDREVEIAVVFKELLNALGDYSLKRLKGATKADLSSEIFSISEMINGLYGLYHP
jgi:hypothetical protein